MPRHIFVIVLMLSAPAAALASEVFLVPIVAQAEAGAFGSVWSSSIAVFNSAGTSVELEGSFHCAFECSSTLDVPAFSSATVPLKEHSGASGTLMRVVRGSSESLHFGARFWNEARQTLDAGTTMPVVTANDFSIGEPFYLPLIPLDENSRLHLRIYEVSEAAGPAVRVRFFTTIDSHTIRGVVLSLRRSSESPYVPQFAELTGLESLIPELDALGPGRLLGIEITPLTGGAYWGFASLTNNITQHVTAFYPDR